SQTDYLDGPSRLRDFLAGAFGEIVGRDVKGPVNLTIAKNPQSVFCDLAKNALVDEFLRTNFGSLVELRKLADIDGRKLLLEYRIREAAFRHAPVERHLAAFKPALLAAAGARPHAFIPASRRLPVPGSRTTTYSLRLMRRTRIGS